VEGLEGRALLSTLIVNSTDDSGPGTLRDRVANAQAGDVIRFDPSLFGKSISLTSGEIDINVSLSIQGPGTGKLAVSGGDSSAVFGIGGAGASVTVSGLTLTQGHAARGGAIHDDAAGGQLTVQNCYFQDDLAFLPTGTPGTAAGGAIASRAPLVVDGCGFGDDHALGSSGPGTPLDQGNSAYGGAIYCDAPRLTVTNSTFEGCSTSGGVGNLYGGVSYGGAVAWLPSSNSDSKVTPIGTFTSDSFRNDDARGNAQVSQEYGSAAGGGAVDVSAGGTSGLQLRMGKNHFSSDHANGGDGFGGGVAEGGSVRLDAGGAVGPFFWLHDNSYSDVGAYGGSAIPVWSGAGVGGEARGGAVAALAAHAISPAFSIIKDQVISSLAKGGHNIQQTPVGDAPTQGGDARGGGLYLDAGTSSKAQFLVSYTLMNEDAAQGGVAGDPAPGGANGAVSVDAAPGGSAWGGGLDAVAGDAFDPKFRLYGDEIVHSSATGGDGGQGTAISASFPATVGGLGGSAYGGGAVFDAGTALSASFNAYASTFVDDNTFGGNGGTGGDGGSVGDAAPGGVGGEAAGGALVVYQDSTPNGRSEPFSATVKLCEFRFAGAFGGPGGQGGAGFAGGTGGHGGEARGGVIWVDAPSADPSDALIFDGDTLSGNRARAGHGGTGGNGDQVAGGAGGAGGDAYGGGMMVYAAGTVKLLDPVIVGCTAEGGFGGDGGSGAGGNGQPGHSSKGFGGGLAAYSYQVGGSVCATAHRTISGNTADIGPDVDGPLGNC
jgi:hypothetical protein